MPKAAERHTTTRRAALAFGASASVGITAGAAASVAELAVQSDVELVRRWRGRAAARGK